MCVTHLRSAALSIITGGGKWVEVSASRSDLSERSGLRGKEVLAVHAVRETPQLINAKPPQPRIEAASKSELANGTVSARWRESPLRLGIC